MQQAKHAVSSVLAPARAMIALVATFAIAFLPLLAKQSVEAELLNVEFSILINLSTIIRGSALTHSGAGLQCLGRYGPYESCNQQAARSDSEHAASSHRDFQLHLPRLAAHKFVKVDARIVTAGSAAL